MDTKHYLNLLDELDDLEQTDAVWNKTKRKEKFAARNPKKLDGPMHDFLRRQDELQPKLQIHLSGRCF